MSDELNTVTNNQPNQGSNDEESLVNLNAVWTLVAILAFIMAIIYLAVIGDQVEFL